MSQYQWKMETKIGPLYLVASNEGLEGIFWKTRPIPLVSSLKGQGRAEQILFQTSQQLEEYLAGKRKAFEIPMASSGTEFQQKVWSELLKIPYGKTLSYSEIARKIKNERAVRAVGTANGKNPFSIIVPCHRVIAADGTLGGYAGGLEIKSQLLGLERG